MSSEGVDRLRAYSYPHGRCISSVAADIIAPPINCRHGVFADKRSTPEQPNPRAIASSPFAHGHTPGMEHSDPSEVAFAVGDAKLVVNVVAAGPAVTVAPKVKAGTVGWVGIVPLPLPEPATAWPGSAVTATTSADAITAPPPNTRQRCHARPARCRCWAIPTTRRRSAPGSAR
jgi:DNA-binding transcriptional LysR family regulator